MGVTLSPPVGRFGWSVTKRTNEHEATFANRLFITVTRDLPADIASNYVYRILENSGTVPIFSTTRMGCASISACPTIITAFAATFSTVYML